MKKLALLVASIALLGAGCLAKEPVETPVVTETQPVVLVDGTYTVNEGSTIRWSGRKLGTEHFGTIGLKSGTVTVANQALTSGELVIDVGTLKDEDIQIEALRNQLEKHLKSADFFDVEKFPTATISIMGIEGSTVIANATIKGITKEIRFPVELIAENDLLYVKGTYEMNRADFDIRYGSNTFFDNLGDSAVADAVPLTIDLVFKRDAVEEAPTEDTTPETAE